MQYPVGHAVAPDGTLVIADFARLSAERVGDGPVRATTRRRRSSPAASSIAAVGAFYMLRGAASRAGAPLSACTARRPACVASVLVAFPTGDSQAKIVARHQEPALAAMEGRFETGPMAEITLIGQPNVRSAAPRQSDQDSGGCSAFSPSARFTATFADSTPFREDDWPTNIELLYYAFHVMAGLGTLLHRAHGAGHAPAIPRRLESAAPLLWVLMLAFPFPFIANTAGWMTAELGRQPWLVYGLFAHERRLQPTSVSSGDVVFTLIGMCRAVLRARPALPVLWSAARSLHGPG